MSAFQKIDDKLNCFAAKRNVTVATSGTCYSFEVPDTLEERNIIWTDGTLCKAILIRPHVRAGTDDNIKYWDFINLAWVEEKITPAKSSSKPMWIKYLAKKASMLLLENKIDILLKQSEENLNNIKRENLRPH